MGSIYQRGRMYWIRYYRHGKGYSEPSHSDKKEVAKRLLQQREGEIAEGKTPGIHFDKVSFKDLAEDFLVDYRVNAKKSLDDAQRSVKSLLEFFGEMRATEITTATVKRYIEKRMNDGLANASINRELAAIKRMFRLAVQCTPPKVGQTPYIPKLKESNVRKGFFEHEEFLSFREALPEYLRPVVTFAYHTGWRKEEILNLTWDRVDRKEGVVRLDPGETKNDEGRTLYLNAELSKLMQVQQINRQLGCSYVFHKDGEKIGEFRKSWETAFIKSGLGASYKCKTCGNLVTLFKEVAWRKRECPKCKGKRFKWMGKIFHDFRRTAVRNMIRSGVPERVAMTLSGHKTRSVFDRYNIVNQEDLREAARRQDAYFQSQTATF